MVLGQACLYLKKGLFVDEIGKSPPPINSSLTQNWPSLSHGDHGRIIQIRPCGDSAFIGTGYSYFTAQTRHWATIVCEYITGDDDTGPTV